MIKEFITFDMIKIEKCKFHCNENLLLFRRCGY